MLWFLKQRLILRSKHAESNCDDLFPSDEEGSVQGELPQVPPKKLKRSKASGSSSSSDPAIAPAAVSSSLGTAKRSKKIKINPITKPQVTATDLFGSDSEDPDEPTPQPAAVEYSFIMDVDIKEQLIKSVDNIKNKIREIQSAEEAATLKYKKVFKPITDNLETMIKSNDRNKPTLNVSIDMSNHDIDENLNSSLDYEDFSKNAQADSNASSEYYDYADDEVTKKAGSPYKKLNDTLASLKDEKMEFYGNYINVPFGIRSENKEMMIGNSKISLSSSSNASQTNKKYVLSIGDRNYELTPGLRELLMRNKPNLNVINEKDKITYKDILHYTNAHKRNFDPDGQIKGDKGLKYRQIIKPLFSQPTKVENKYLSTAKSGGGYKPKYKVYKRNTDYIFWDDPNELIERLKLIIASKNAGNTNHDNEILSIIEELTEAGIIKE
ncbi:unnamed protein product [Diatraea saccharalis]|uniref:DUF8207 domain-containing protein n=1 Tax=Diatraea saccharalis TaxID=40085 RepID=A0A9N9R869_9NEOP|nr:unnamed protein product [Diatraea saccharalis]